MSSRLGWLWPEEHGLSLARFAQSMLYGIEAADFPTFASASLILVGLMLAANYFPARRAMGVDPMVALREE